LAESLNVFSIDAETAFVDALARGLLARFPEPERLSQVQLLLPTRRAGRSLQEAFLRLTEGRALLLPRIRPLGETDADELLIAGEGEVAEGGLAADLPPPMPELTRVLLLARLVLRWCAQNRAEGAPPEDQAVRLAGELARLLDSVETEGLDFGRLGELVAEDYAEHWRKTLHFLEIVTRHWPDVQASLGALGPAERRRLLLQAQAAAWRAQPPAGPVIAAGSTGSIPATAELLKVIAGLPDGMVVLPGLDREMPEPAWAAVAGEPGHPQHTLQRLLAHMEIDREEVRDWPAPLDPPGPAAVARRRLVSTALWPAPATAAWPEVRDTLTAEDARRALVGVRRIDCPDPGAEAGTVALLLREALETPGKRAALVTPDRRLARRVAAELRRWGLEVDDSAGRPLAATPPGGFLRVTAEMVASELAPLPLLAALKHPLAAGGEAPGAFRAKVRRLERHLLRGPRPPAGFEGLLRAAAAEPKAKALIPWLQHLGGLARGLASALRDPAAGLPRAVEAHLAFAEALAATDEEPGAARLWRGEAGEAAAEFCAELRTAAETAPGLGAARYPLVLDSLLAGQAVRRRYGGHPRLAVLGPLEARLQQADRLILGGLNEGTWPAESEPGPWMSRPMRADFGLPPVERKIGLAAHDLQQAFGAPEVILTRAERVEGAPTVPSRWLLRLDALLSALGAPGALADESAVWAARVQALDAPDAVRPCEPPAPRPPLEARPTRLSVTQVETWMRDPYAIYARHILGLRRLDELDQEPGAADKGQIVHKALEEFCRAYPDTLPPEAEDELVRLGAGVFEAIRHRPALYAFWWPRFRRVAAWVTEVERARRGGIVQLLSEVEGETEIAGFTLTARADRIERRRDGSLALIDYKTGTVPANTAIRLGFSPQLALEAVIAKAGAFEKLDAAPVGELAFWRLTGAHPPGELSPVKAGERNLPSIDELAEQACAGVAELATRFRDPATPYHARPRPAWAPAYSDYEHLARLREWAAVEGEEG
jgi:ATP-dependent helicase/nuclease subunit B